MEEHPVASERRGITVGTPVAGGWRCVDDSGRPLVLPAAALDDALRTLRVGQRLIAVVDDGAVIHATLP